MIINSVIDLINEITKDINKWNPKYKSAWFRGEKEDSEHMEYSLLPKLYIHFKKNETDKSESHEVENNIIQDFRMRARAFNNIPEYERIDEWLFLMQHVESYTRLLDWTEGALFALYFAINKEPEINKESENNKKPEKNKESVVWMLNPVIFNLVMNQRLDLPLSWGDGTNIYNIKTGELEYYKKTIYNKYGDLKKAYKRLACPGNIHAAFEDGKCIYEEENPIALKPQYIHQRVAAQRGCFTVHGKKNENILNILKNKKLDNNKYKEIFEFNNLGGSYDLFKGHDGVFFENIYLKKYTINSDREVQLRMLYDLRLLGITNYNLFPELTGLSNDLTNVYIHNHKMDFSEKRALRKR